MDGHVAERRLMRLLAAVLTVLWAATGVAVAATYRPGGPIDIAVMLACFLPVLVADAGFVWPAVARTRRHRVVLVWTWIAAVLFAIPVLYGTVATLTAEGPQSLVPSYEAAYAGILALFTTAWFSVTGWVHQRRGIVPLDRRASLLTAGLAGLLTIIVGIAFIFVAVVNDRDLRAEQPSDSRFGPTDPDLEPPFCDEPIALGANALVTIEAKSSLDNADRGVARLEGRRGDRDESWGGSWSGPDGAGESAYLRVGRLAWLTDQSDDPHAPGTAWQRVEPNPFGLAGRDSLTMDGPPHAIADAPRGSIVAEDLGLEHIEGARARHCRTFIDGPTALDTFLPLRWLLYDGSLAPEGAISRWRGELDWWVFGDGELGLASAEVSGSEAETDWGADGVRVVLEARLEAVDRDQPVDVGSPVGARATAAASAATPAPATTLESDAS